MLSEFLRTPHRIQEIRRSPSGALLEAFAAYLFQSRLYHGTCHQRM